MRVHEAKDASFGDTASKAGRFGQEWGGPGPPNTWKRNAARHALWAALLAAEHGEVQAGIATRAHEHNESGLDTFVDRWNNEEAIRIGKDLEPHEVEDAIRKALDEGVFITDPLNPIEHRVPDNLKRPTLPGSSPHQ